MMASKHKSSATVIPLDRSVGKVLAHDITEIRPGQFKGAAFRKGHIVTEEDLEHLRRIGKEHLFVLHIKAGEIHEDEAASRLVKGLSGMGVFFDPEPSEGKISLKAAHRGLLKVDVESLLELNLVPDMCCSSRHNNILVEQGEIIAATRVIPLIIDETVLNRALRILDLSGPIFSVKKLSEPRTGLIITGNEIYNGLIDDKFAPILRKKLQSLGCKLMKPRFKPDDEAKIADGVKSLLQEGAKLIIVAGGMSVDPDDVSRMGIVRAGARDGVYGTPVLPGAMFLYGRIDDIPILGVPACVLYYKATVLDLILPRVLAGEKISRKDLAALGYGGLCLNCDQCRYPVCPFGKA